MFHLVRGTGHILGSVATPGHLRDPAGEVADVGIVGGEVVRGKSWWISIVWCLRLAALGYRWSNAVFNRDLKQLNAPETTGGVVGVRRRVCYLSRDGPPRSGRR
ncbi:hypothetical protein ABZ016_39440 [Streptomyces sp. NPDC006372]|uniref:hypothetical protein n=1 Tax=Streptomyces sp. NPDC006372 TaxID=3155599 RepID=UPI0033A614F6